MASVLENPAVRRAALPISVEQYHCLGMAGVIEQQTELLRGVIVAKMVKSPRHSWLVQFLVSWARTEIPMGLHVRQEQPITLVDSEPEPDVAIVAGRFEDFRNAHPTTAVVVMEVSISSVEIDREKASLYAQAGVSEYAIIIPSEAVVEVYRNPSAAGYAEKQFLKAGAQLTFHALPGQTLELSELFA